MSTVSEPPVERSWGHQLLLPPNLISFVRLLCLPLFVYLLLGRDNRAGAAWLLAGLGATDWVDGFIARRFGQVSELGKMLDPTVDRLLFIVGITAIIVDDSVPLWFAVAVLAREFVLGVVIAISKLFLGMSRFDVTWWGKTATFLLMGAFPGFLLGASDFPGATGFEWAAWIAGIPGLILSYYTAATYLPTIREHLHASRRATT